MKALLMLLPLTLAACMAGPDATTRAATAPQADAAVTISSTTLSRQHWQLRDAVDGSNKRLDALLGLPDKPLQLDFSADRISVSNACNRISGSYRIVEGHLVTTQLLQTRMACADPTLTQRETTITTVLQGGPTLILSSANHTPLLTLADANGRTLTFAGVPTADARSGDDGDTAPQQP
jgi:heat shock protein HslJ